MYIRTQHYCQGIRDPILEQGCTDPCHTYTYGEGLPGTLLK